MQSKVMNESVMKTYYKSIYFFPSWSKAKMAFKCSSVVPMRSSIAVMPATKSSWVMILTAGAVARAVIGSARVRLGEGLAPSDSTSAYAAAVWGGGNAEGKSTGDTDDDEDDWVFSLACVFVPF